jgi:hypothetical protein
MKVRCINGSRFLIKDKIYEVMSVKGDMYVRQNHFHKNNMNGTQHGFTK